MATRKQSLYEILGVAPDANDIDLGLAYEKRRAEAEKVHHDPNELALVQQAYEILSNPKRRAAYDAQRTTAAEVDVARAMDQADLVIEGAEAESKRRKWLVPAIIAAFVLIALYFGLRSGPAPQKAEPPPAAEVPKPAPPPPPQPMKAEQILPAAVRATGQLLSYDMTGAAVPAGIAFTIEPGTVITTCHGLSAGSKVVFRQGTEMHSAELTVVDELLDLCKLAVPGLSARALPVAPEEAKADDRIFTLGMNAKGEFALTEGTVKQARMGASVKFLEVSMPIAAPASGGPVFDAFGRVVGIATTPHRFGTGVNAAISSGWFSQMRSRARAQQ